MIKESFEKCLYIGICFFNAIWNFEIVYVKKGLGEFIGVLEITWSRYKFFYLNFLRLSSLFVVIGVSEVILNY